MKKFYTLLIVLLFAVATYSVFSSASHSQPYDFSKSYDPKRNPEADLKAATKVAQETNRLVLIELGGDWCSWCHILDEYIDNNSEIREALYDRFVIMKVNVSDENNNDAFKAKMPGLKGYPHFVIANAKGKILGYQNTGKLESGRSYSETAFKAFIQKWQTAK